MVVWCTGS
uniref:Uncharacterized protein n=1 Tax=Arundo donax TaxID=35708 RepID=A0A0A9FL79_ARUDO